MDNLSEDDLNLKDMTDEELAAAWNLWFDLAQSTNDFDPPYTHGVFVRKSSPRPVWCRSEIRCIVSSLRRVHDGRANSSVP
jgi:hypothetical protein